MFSNRNNCYTPNILPEQSKCPGYVSQRRKIYVGRTDLNRCGTDQLKIMWVGMTGSVEPYYNFQVCLLKLILCILQTMVGSLCVNNKRYCLANFERAA